MLDGLSDDVVVAARGRRCPDPRRRAPRERDRRLLGGPAARRSAPAPGWRGSRAASASARPSRPVCSRRSCPAVVRSRTPRPASTSRRCGASTASPPSRDARPARSSPPPAPGLLGGLVVGGLEPADLPDPAIAREALDVVPFLVSLEVRRSEVTDRADVVLPVAPPSEKSGTFVTWEGRPRPFPQALVSHALADHRVLDRLADALGVDLGLQTLAAVHAELDQLGGWDGARVAAPSVRPAEPPAVSPGHRRAGHLAPAARHRSPAVGRAVPRRHRQARRRPHLARAPRRASASSTAARSPSAPTPARSRCRSSSRTCRTTWSGCRRTRWAARSATPCTPTPETWCALAPGPRGRAENEEASA